MRDKIIDILHAVLEEDLEGVARTFYALAIPQGPVDFAAWERDVVEIAERYLVGIPMAEIQIGALFSQIVAGATRHNVRMPTDFTMMFKAILTTEGLAKSLAPEVDPLERARPFIAEMFAERYSPERIKQLAIADFTLYQRLLRALPQVLPGLLGDLRDGKLALRLSDDTLGQINRAADVRTRRMIRGAVTITCLACGTYSLGLDLPVWPFFGIPWVSACFFLAAAGGLAAMALL
jgi:ubiquinone biosynthesis protein